MIEQLTENIPLELVLLMGYFTNFSKTVFIKPCQVTEQYFLLGFFTLTVSAVEPGRRAI